MKIPEDSDSHLLHAAVTAAAAAATALASLDEVTELLLPLLLPCLWYSSRTIILSRSEDPDNTLLKRCRLGGALNIVREAPEGMGDSVDSGKKIRQFFDILKTIFSTMFFEFQIIIALLKSILRP